jgi:hypothetical protein
MGLRRNILEAITLKLNDQTVVLNDGSGNAKTITVVNTLFDPSEIPFHYLPKFSCVPAIEQIQLTLSGRSMDDTLRIALFGYCTHDKDETLFAAAEDLIEKVIQLLTSIDNVAYFNETINFAITEIGPIICEQRDDQGDVAYISMPLAIVLVE